MAGHSGRAVRLAGARVLLASCLLMLVSCRMPEQLRSEGQTRGIVQVNVITAPVALNLDERPGVDGLSLKVYANNATNPKAVPIPSGQLEILMFDGRLRGKTDAPAPLRTWSFSAQELKESEFTATIGVGYAFVLHWGAQVPTQRLITVMARYTAPDGRVIDSRPNSVTVAAK